MPVFTEELFSLKDEAYKEFHSKIVPDTKYEIIGVRMPKMRELVKRITRKEDIRSFFGEKHVYYEEFLLHGLLIAKLKNPDDVYPLLEDFLPTIDNWAICDTVASALKILAKDKERLLKNVRLWLASDKTYTVRFGLVCLLNYFTESKYSACAIELATAIKTDEYYINMAIAWLLSVILVKDYGSALPLIESRTLPKFIQNKTIDKARDSFRIPQDKKNHLKKFKI